MKQTTAILGFTFLLLVIGTEGDWSGDRNCLGGGYYSYLKSLVSVVSMENDDTIKSYASGESGYASTQDLAGFDKLTSQMIQYVTSHYNTLVFQQYQQTAIQSATRTLCQHIKGSCQSYWSTFPLRGTVKSVYETYGSGRSFTSLCGKG